MSASTNRNNLNASYYLLTQNADDLLVIGIKGVNTCLRRTAAEVLAEPTLLAGLSIEDKDIIEAIADKSGIHPTHSKAKLKNR